MTFKATVIYQTLDGKIMTKEIERVKKIEREFDRILDENFEVVRIYTTYSNWTSWKAEAIININMIAEQN